MKIKLVYPENSRNGSKRKRRNEGVISVLSYAFSPQALSILLFVKTKGKTRNIYSRIS